MPKIRCPSCNNEGRTELGSDAFQVRGTWPGKPVRKCLRCGAGITISPPKHVKLIEPELWGRMQESWAREFGEDEKEEAELGEANDALSESEYPVARCPYCGNSGSTEPGSLAFEYRVKLDEPKVRMCRRCERGFWMDSETGETEPMSEESWAGIEMLHEMLGGGARVDAEWAGRAVRSASDAADEAGDDSAEDESYGENEQGEPALGTDRSIDRSVEEVARKDELLMAVASGALTSPLIQTL